MSHGYGCGLAGNRMRMAAGRDENRTFHKFVQVGTADAAPSDVDADGAGGDGRFGDVFDADVAFIVKTCCFHTELLNSRGGIWGHAFVNALET